VNLTSGTAALTTTKLLIGSQAITAVYSGDSTYMPSTSVASTVDVVFTGTVAVTVTDNTGDLSSASLAVIVQ
jgi:hypothetical protein